MERLRRKRQVRTPAKAHINARDTEILQYLARYRFLPSRHLHALVGGHPNWFLRRLRQLFDAGYINRVERQFDFANAYYQPLVYEITDKGLDTLQATGADIRRALFIARGSKSIKEYHHSLYACKALANIEIGAKKAGNKLIYWPQILDKAPEETRERSHPNHLPVDIKAKADGKKLSKPRRPLIPDALFGIKYPQGVKWYAFEADMGTEPLVRKHLDASSIGKKLLQYEDIMERRTYASHLNLQNLRVLIATTRENPDGILRAATPNNYLYAISTSAPDSEGRLFRAEWQKKGKTKNEPAYIKE